MSDYFGECPEPSRTREYANISNIQHTGGQYEIHSQQYLGSPNLRQLGEEVSRAVYNGIFGRETQQE